MAKCDLTIKIEQQKAVYLPGDIVCGTIEATVDDAVKCNGLKAGIRWRTFGKGDSVDEEIESETLFEGEWEAGRVYSEYFEFELPAGPYTYHGHHLNVLWEVFACADIPWARDPETAVEIALKPDPAKEPDWVAAAGSADFVPMRLLEKGERESVASANPAGYAEKALGIGVLVLVVGALVLVIGGIIVFIAITGWGIFRFAKGEYSLSQGIPLMIFAAIFLAIIYRIFKAILERKKLGAVTLMVDPKRVRAGGKIDMSVRCKPNKAIKLRAATARIVATEIVKRGSGSHSKTFRHVVYEDDFELASAVRLRPGIPFQAGTPILIPYNVPSSFYAPGNNLSWQVEVRFDIVGGSDWSKSTEILVHA